MGLASGGTAVAFRAALGAADAFRAVLISLAHRVPAWGWLAPVSVGAAGAFFGVWSARRYAPEAAGSGIPHLEAVLHRRRVMNWARVLPVKFFGGVAAIGAGLALGREGPTVQMGGAVGLGIARWLKVSKRDALALAAAGAGAGLAAAFNAPLAGLVFVLEELQRDFRPTVFATAFLAAATADVVARVFAGQLPTFSVPAYATPDLRLLPAFALLGIAAAILGVAFNRSLLKTVDLASRLNARVSLALAAALGAVIGGIAVGWPTLVGGGHTLAERALAGSIGLAVIPAFFLARFAMSMTSYGTGAPGGIFAPLLALGALLGLGVGHLVVLVLPAGFVEPGVFAVVGMAAYFTAIVRAPLTGIVLIIEMTTSYAQMLPLLVACFCAYAVAEAMGEMPIYEALLQRDLLKGGLGPTFEEPIVIELEVQPGSAFAGKTVRDLGLPAGVMLIGVRQGNHEWVPNAQTVLQAHERVIAVVSPDAKEGLSVLRNGCSDRDHIEAGTEVLR